MTSNPATPRATPTRQLRLWPAVVLAVLELVARFIVPRVVPDWTGYGLLGGMACGAAIVLWWLFFSRAPWSERLGAVALMGVALYATPFILHPSIAGGAMGMLFYVLVIPTLSLAFVTWAVASPGLAPGPRWAAMAAAIFFGCGVWALVQTGGFNTNFENDLAWRWSSTPEERLVAQGGDELPPLPVRPEPSPSAPVVAPSEPARPTASIAPTPARPAAPPPAPPEGEVGAEWPGFRGAA